MNQLYNKLGELLKLIEDVEALINLTNNGHRNKHLNKLKSRYELELEELDAKILGYKINRAG